MRVRRAGAIASETRNLTAEIEGPALERNTVLQDSQNIAGAGRQSGCGGSGAAGKAVRKAVTVVAPVMKATPTATRLGGADTAISRAVIEHRKAAIKLEISFTSSVTKQGHMQSVRP